MRLFFEYAAFWLISGVAGALVSPCARILLDLAELHVPAFEKRGCLYERSILRDPNWWKNVLTTQDPRHRSAYSLAGHTRNADNGGLAGWQRPYVATQMARLSIGTSCRSKPAKLTR